MSEENQHWVPKFVVKNFTDRDGRVFRLDIETDEVTKPPPRRAASDINFNEFVIDGKVISFEDSLTKIETPAAPIFRRIAAARSTASLTDSDRMRAAKFMAAQSFRTEAFYKGIEGHKARNDFGAVFKQLWESAFLVADDIARRHWILLSIEHDDVFNLGDHPLVLQNTENPSAGGPLGFDIQGVEAFLPLTPKCALYMPCVSTSTEIITGYENAVQIHRHMRSTVLTGSMLPGMNSEMLHLAQRVMKNSHPLYQALKTGSPLSAASEIVENLNYLQCAWAYKAVYSNRGDFSFAKHVFEKTPQYRKSPRTSVVPGRWHEPSPTMTDR